MPNDAHQLAVQIIAEHPECLDLIAERLLGRSILRNSHLADSTVRFVELDEARPDLIFEAPTGWVAVEVQSQVDPEKARRWLVMVSLKLSQSRRMGDLVVLTFSRAVATWAPEVAHLEGSLGTTLQLKPIVLLLADDALEKLLDEAHPELAFFAAWAMQERYGPQATSVVKRALKLTHRLPAALQEPMQRAIMSVLHQKMKSFLKELEMDISQIPEGAAVRAYKADVAAEAEARARADAVLSVLDARGLPITNEIRERVLATSDVVELNRLLRRAATIESADALFG